MKTETNRLLREKQIIGCKKQGIPSLIPVSHSHFWEQIAKGRFPKGIKLSEKVTVWKESDVLKWIEEKTKTS